MAGNREPMPLPAEWAGDRGVSFGRDAGTKTRPAPSRGPVGMARGRTHDQSAIQVKDIFEHHGSRS